MLGPESNHESFRARAESAERRFQALVRASAQLVWLAAPGGQLTEDSPTWREFTGQTLEQFLGDGWLNAVHPEDRARTRHIWQRAVRTGARYETLYRVQHHSGGWRTMTARGYPVAGDDGAVEGWVGLNDDVTERRSALARIEESESQFRTLAETTSNMIWVADANARIFYWNPAWSTFTGRPVERGLGLKAAHVIRPDHRTAILRGWSRAIRRGSKFGMDVPLRAADGSYEWFTSQACPIRNSFGAVIRWCGVMTNINCHKVLTRSLLEERTNRERFVSAMVHDLKNAFGTGKGAMTALLESPTDDEQQESLAKLVTRSFERAGRMVEDLLDANRIGAGRGFPLGATEPLALRALVVDVTRDVGRNRAVDVRVDPELVVWWSHKNLVRILENLLSNAFKYGDAARPVTVRAELADETVTWSVHNWGNPIPESDRARLFAFLERAPAARRSGVEGWGIGLTLVKGLVEAHGGTIRVESDPDHGTSFVVQMPARVGPGEA